MGKHSFEIITALFQQSVSDYLFLKNRNYPAKSALKLVADQYRLSSTQRILLYRGISSSSTALLRRAKLSSQVAGKVLYVDGYNVCFTLMNYLTGRVVFIGNDGFLRDCGGAYRKDTNEAHFSQAISLLMETISAAALGGLVIYLDKRMPRVERHAELLEQELHRGDSKVEICLVSCADQAILTEASKSVPQPGFTVPLTIPESDCVIATSDSEIIDAAPCRIYDLARAILSREFNVAILSLEQWQ